MRALLTVNLLILSASLLFVACKKPSQHDLVRAAAERYYGYLVDGNVDAYVRGLHDYDCLSEDYRRQLCDMFTQYLWDEQHKHKGLYSVRAVNDTIIDDQYAHVFVSIQFGDSTYEEVLLPLVLTPDGWRLK